MVVAAADGGFEPWPETAIETIQHHDLANLYFEKRPVLLTTPFPCCATYLEDSFSIATSHDRNR